MRPEILGTGLIQGTLRELGADLSCPSLVGLITCFGGVATIGGIFVFAIMVRSSMTNDV